MSDINNDLDTQVAEQQQAVQATIPLVGVDFTEDGRVRINLQRGIEPWQAIGALEVALKILKSQYE